MRIEIPPTLQTIDLGDFNTAAQGKKVYVWVDPPAAFLKERTLFQREYFQFFEERQKLAAPKGEQEKNRRQLEVDEFLNKWNPKVHDWLARLWSQGPEGSHWTTEELDTLNDENPKFLEWLVRKAYDLLDNYCRAEKNA